MDRTLAHIAQAEFTALRQRCGRKAALLASPRLIVLPDRFMEKLGGAAAIYRWICISPQILEAPEDVRRAVIAHEWGHALSGHCLATTGSVFLVLGYAWVSWTAAPGSIGAGMLAIALLAVAVALVLWALAGEREFEADAAAAELIGAEQLAEGLRWIMTNRRHCDEGGRINQRIKRLSEPVICSK